MKTAFAFLAFSGGMLLLIWAADMQATSPDMHTGESCVEIVDQIFAARNTRGISSSDIRRMDAICGLKAKGK